MSVLTRSCKYHSREAGQIENGEVGMASLTGQFGSGNFTRPSIAEIALLTAGWCYFNLHNNRPYGHVDDRPRGGAAVD